MSREKILIRTSWVSTIGNAILSASKIIVGLFAGVGKMVISCLTADVHEDKT